MVDVLGRDKRCLKLRPSENVKPAIDTVDSSLTNSNRNGNETNNSYDKLSINLQALTLNSDATRYDPPWDDRTCLWKF